MYVYIYIYIHVYSCLCIHTLYINPACTDEHMQHAPTRRGDADRGGGAQGVNNSY